jgi:hypothetical protein
VCFACLFFCKCKLTTYPEHFRVLYSHAIPLLMGQARCKYEPAIDVLQVFLFFVQ